jgi:DoxX-like family
MEEHGMQFPTQPGAVSKGSFWAGCILSALPVLLFAFTGAFSLLKPVVSVQGFVHYGYPEGALLRITIAELACAILYAIPRTSVLGAILLTGYLGGATATHLRVGEPFYLPIIVGVVIWLGLYLRDGRLRELIPLRS